MDEGSLSYPEPWEGGGGDFDGSGRVAELAILEASKKGWARARKLQGDSIGTQQSAAARRTPHAPVRTPVAGVRRHRAENRRERLPNHGHLQGRGHRGADTWAGAPACGGTRRYRARVPECHNTPGVGGRAPGGRPGEGPHPAGRGSAPPRGKDPMRH